MSAKIAQNEIVQRALAMLQNAKAKQQPSPSLRDRYHQTADAVLHDCLEIDAAWLIEKHPFLWQRMTNLDRRLDALEQRPCEPAEYETLLEKLTATVKEARTLYEQERHEPAKH